MCFFLTATPLSPYFFPPSNLPMKLKVYIFFCMKAERIQLVERNGERWRNRILGRVEMLMYAKARRTKKYCCYERNSHSRPKLPPYTHTSLPSPLFPFCFFGLYHRECKQLTVTKERKSPADVFIRMNRKKKGIQVSEKGWGAMKPKR